MSREQLANDIWHACDIMRRDNNCGGIMEYMEHLAWVLFLKFLDDQEQYFKQEAEKRDIVYAYMIDQEYRWSEWVPKAVGEKVWLNDRRGPAEWKLEETMYFVRRMLLPYLSNLSGSPERDVIASVFSGERNVVVCASSQNLKDVLEIIDNINFMDPDDIHTVSHVYEGLLKRMGNENKMAGEFYTPRPVIRFMVKVINPEAGEKVYDPACGSCGFLVEAYEHMKAQAQLTRNDEALQKGTLFGVEKKAVPALLGILNLVLHGVTAPKVYRYNTLEENNSYISDRFDVILTNPPFGGTENIQVQMNYEVKSNATELLFTEHIMKKLDDHDGARCAMVVPEGTLFRGGAFATVKKKLLTEFKLFMIVSLPPGTFAPYSDVKTALLFFQRPGPTTEVLYYEMPLNDGFKRFSKRRPIADKHFVEAFEIWENWQAYCEDMVPFPIFPETSWIETYETLVRRGYDLTAKNPNELDDEKLPDPAELTEKFLGHLNELHTIMERVHAAINSDKGAL